MAEVTLNVNGRPYKIGCDEGQENRVMELGAFIDNTVSQISSAGAASNDSHLLVLASLVMADELFESRNNGNGKAETAPAALAAEDAVDIERYTEVINHLATRVEELAKRLEHT